MSNLIQYTKSFGLFGNSKNKITFSLNQLVTRSSSVISRLITKSRYNEEIETEYDPDNLHQYPSYETWLSKVRSTAEFQKPSDDISQRNWYDLSVKDTTGVFGNHYLVWKGEKTNDDVVNIAYEVDKFKLEL